MAFVLRKPPKLSPRVSAYPYQLDAVRTLKSLDYAAVFHEQGLGKTKIAIDLLLSWLEQDRVDTVIIVTKKSLVQNWVEEVAFHSHVTPRVLSGNKRDNGVALNSPVLAYITNYEVISANLNLIQDFLAICKVGAVLDESHKIKNPDARVSRSLHAIAENISPKIIMTGTPVANRPYDLWSQIRFLDGGASLGDSFQDFRDRFDLPKGNEQRRDFERGVENVLSSIRPFVVRETKQTAGLELPNKTIVTHKVTMSEVQAGIYSAYREQLRYEIKLDQERVIDDAEAILKRLLRLVQCASNPGLLEPRYAECPGKLRRLLELLEEIDIANCKAIIWSGFVDNLAWLSDEIQNWRQLIGVAKVHGRMPIDRRSASVQRFKTDDRCRILLATPGAAKEGLTLTVANHAVFFDRSFSLDDYLQAQDRIHRISQGKECFVHNLIASETIDEWVDALLNAKHQVAAFAQGDTAKEDFAGSLIDNLDHMLREVLGS